ncbi:hypothetical protein [Amycolatopsis sulphurea]|uniref:hypothetical protein n=1 Tax=Amycolatopsis sulphurea TaxID=76022 RepID=UPI001145DA15|nr:hypothetical protein [Amycolatopsis sulphurea]
MTAAARRVLAAATATAALWLSTACGATPAPPAAPAPTAGTAQAADNAAALRDHFSNATKSAGWAAQVTEIKLDGEAVIVTTTLTKAEKAATLAACEAGRKAASDAQVNFQSVSVRSADDRTLAHQNEKYGPKNCEN